VEVRGMSTVNGGLEYETEWEEELEIEGEEESEEFLGTLVRGVGSLLGGGAGEGEEEWEVEGEEEWEVEGEGEVEGEEFLGTIARGLGSLIGGGGAGEGEEEWEVEGEYEGEEEGEEFMRRLRGFIRRAAPVLRQVARVAAPIVGTAVGGPAGAAIGRAVGGMLEGEEEWEIEGEIEGETEGETEWEAEAEAEVMRQGVTLTQAQAELMAAQAAVAQNEAEAEAMIGAASVAVLTPADRIALRRVLPHIVRGAAILTRVLRRRRITRPVVRTVPTIVARTARTLAAQQAATGRPVTRAQAGRCMSRQVRRVLGRPPITARALQRNVRTAGVARVAARSPRPVQVLRRAQPGRPPVRAVSPVVRRAAAVGPRPGARPRRPAMR
jgi:hypothetical protein